MSGYRPGDYYAQNTGLREMIDFIGSRELGSGDQELFRPIVDNLLGTDPFFLLADYQAYIDAQEKVSTLWHDEAAWTRKSILNTARMGKFCLRSIDPRLLRANLANPTRILDRHWLHYEALPLHGTPEMGLERDDSRPAGRRLGLRSYRLTKRRCAL